MSELARDILQRARTHNGYDTYTCCRLVVVYTVNGESTVRSVHLCRKSGPGAEIVALNSAFTSGIVPPASKAEALKSPPLAQFRDLSNTWDGPLNGPKSALTVSLQSVPWRGGAAQAPAGAPVGALATWDVLSMLMSSNLDESDAVEDMNCNYLGTALWEAVNMVKALVPGPAAV